MVYYVAVTIVNHSVLQAVSSLPDVIKLLKFLKAVTKIRKSNCYC